MEYEERNKNMSTQQHYFFAISIPPSTKEKLAKYFDMQQHVFPFKKPVFVEDYHITLVFLGAIQEEIIPALIEKVKECIHHLQSFHLRVDGYGIFGTPRSPRIFWNSVHYEEQLFTLQKQVAKACMQQGLMFDTRPYSPHITLARKWASTEPFKEELLQLHNPFQDELVQFDVSNVVLYKTNINQLPRYEVVYKIPLKSMEQ